MEKLLFISLTVNVLFFIGCLLVSILPNRENITLQGCIDRLKYDVQLAITNDKYLRNKITEYEKLLKQSLCNPIELGLDKLEYEVYKKYEDAKSQQIKDLLIENQHLKEVISTVSAGVIKQIKGK